MFKSFGIFENKNRNWWNKRQKEFRLYATSTKDYERNFKRLPAVAVAMRFAKRSDHKCEHKWFNLRSVLVTSTW